MDAETSTGDVEARMEQIRRDAERAIAEDAARVGDVRPVGLPRKLRRHLKALERRANRRLLRAAYRELRMLRREEGQLPFKTNEIERGEVRAQYNPEGDRKWEWPDQNMLTVNDPTGGRWQGSPLTADKLEAAIDSVLEGVR